MYVLAYMMFLMGLAGYALFHLGNIYDGGPKYDFKVSYVNGVFNYLYFAIIEKCDNSKIDCKCHLWNSECNNCIYCK